MDDGLAGSLLGLGGFFPEGPAGDGDRVAMGITTLAETLGDDSPSPGFIDIGNDELSRGLKIDQQRRARADGLEIVDGELDAGFMRQGEQMQHGVGGSAGGGNGCDRVLEGHGDNEDWLYRRPSRLGRL